jgi:predicted transcriptional regulator
MGVESDIQDSSSTFCSSLGPSALYGSEGLTTKVRRGKKRTREEIIYQILEACCEGIKKTAVANKVALNANIASSYLEMLIRNGMIEKKGRLYIITLKGAKILPVMKNVQDAFTNSTGAHTE